MAPEQLGAIDVRGVGRKDVEVRTTTKWRIRGAGQRASLRHLDSQGPLTIQPTSTGAGPAASWPSPTASGGLTLAEVWNRDEAQEPCPRTAPLPINGLIRCQAGVCWGPWRSGRWIKTRP